GPAARDRVADLSPGRVRLRGAHLMAAPAALFERPLRPGPVVTERRGGRVASRPGPEDGNPYFRLMYGAFDRAGVHYAGAFQINDAWLRSHAADFDALHLHWPEWLWRIRGHSRLHMIVGLSRYLALAKRLGLLRVWTVHNLLPHEWQAADAP